MLVVVSYDVETTDAGGRRRLRRIARTCQDYGQRVQFSVFECEVTPGDWVKLRANLLEKMDQDRDSLRRLNEIRRRSSPPHGGAD